MEEEIDVTTEEEKMFREAADHVEDALNDKIDEVNNVLKGVPNWMCIAILDLVKSSIEFHIYCPAEES